MKNIFLLSMLAIVLINSGCGDKEVLGCMNSSATNFNPEANVSDGSCIINGCTVETASNYNPEVTQSDGSCIFMGCTDASAANYDPNANEDDGTCIYPGCTDEEGDQYDAMANEDDGSCTFFNRWSGTFMGDFDCEGALLNAYFGEATMTFSKVDLPDNKDSVEVFIEFSLSEIPLNFGAIITRDSMYANAFFPMLDTDVDIVPSIEGEVFDIALFGVLGISEDNNKVDGVLKVSLVETALGIGLTYDDSCAFDGDRQ